MDKQQKRERETLTIRQTDRKKERKKARQKTGERETMYRPRERYNVL